MSWSGVFWGFELRSFPLAAELTLENLIHERLANCMTTEEMKILATVFCLNEDWKNNNHVDVYRIPAIRR